jgi:Uncharacterised nucleotidyltransferase
MPLTASSSEIDLILMCARVSGERAPLSVTQPVVVDWEEFCKTAAWHGLSALVYWRLHSDCPEAVPAGMLSRLRDAFHQTAAHNLLLASELIKLLTVLREAQIPAAPLKGPALAFSVYENFALRTFDDLDVLVPRSQACRAIELLTASGYAPALNLRGGAAAAYVKTAYEMQFEYPDSPCKIELHWGLQEEKFFSAALRPEGWWERMEWMEIAGSRVMAPSRSDTLLFLCAHGAKHRWERLKWICDIAALIQSLPEFDWESIYAQASALRVERMLLLGLLLANQILDCPLPQEVLRKALAEPGVAALAAQVRQRLYEKTLTPGLLETARFHILLRKRWRDKLRYLSVNTFVPTAGEWKMVELPGFLAGLYYPLRPVRLLKDALSGSSSQPLPHGRGSVQPVTALNRARNVSKQTCDEVGPGETSSVLPINVIGHQR